MDELPAAHTQLLRLTGRVDGFGRLESPVPGTLRDVLRLDEEQDLTAMWHWRCQDLWQQAGDLSADWLVPAVRRLATHCH